MKRVAIITYSEEDAILYSHQLSTLFSGLIWVESLSTRAHRNKQWPAADLYLIGNTALSPDDLAENHCSANAEQVFIHSTFTKKAIAKIRAVPEGTKALFVSCNATLCDEAITRIRELGISHIELTPYYPGVPYMGDLEYAITPGESRYMPEVIRHMVDVGSRYLDADTVMEVAIRLNLDQTVSQDRLNKYFSQLADNTYNYNMLVARSVRSENRMEILLDILSDGIVGIDETGTVFAYNRAAERMLGIAKSQVMGKNSQKLLGMIPFHEASKTADEPILVRFRNTLLNMLIEPIVYNGKHMGRFAHIQRFSEEESKQNLLRGQLAGNNSQAKYTFEDIIHESASITHACEIAKKMARTDSSILITGESGTGKELLAHAIHNASPRSGKPFIAINCAALPDTLLESELFGYEEGSFTGAKKGGKPGLFEFAHTGSIFLDEVEGMSPSLQVKLLRVLQEKEIMHIGGNSVIHIDVRIIATTNIPLQELVAEGKFRSDLYYRLCTLPITLPPLRDRVEDIPVFVKHFRRSMGATFLFTENAIERLRRYPWPGNVRELRNCVEYCSYLEKDHIAVEDLPPAISAFTAAEQAMPTAAAGPAADTLSLFVLRRLRDAEAHNARLGRDKLLKLLAENGTPLSQPAFRKLMGELQEQGLIVIAVGRGGTAITDLGRTYLEHLSETVN